MTVLPEVRRQLLESREVRPRVRVAPVLVAAATVLIAGVFLVGLGAGGRPRMPATVNPAGGAPHAWVNALAEAWRKTPCAKPLNATGHVRMLESAPAPALVHEFPALGVPATGSHRVSEAFLRRAHVYATAVYARYVWSERVDGVRLIIVPAAGYPHHSAGCRRQVLAAFAARLGDSPPAVRWAQARIEATLGPGVTVLDFERRGNGQDNSLLTRAAYSPRSAGGGPGNYTLTTMLVPAAVATVTAHYTSQRHPGLVAHAFSVTIRPVHDLAVFVLRAAWDPPSLVARSASGRVLWSSPR